ncbi:MAG: hypothetical protein IKY83_11350 [Proteobacteria bacterium]|nr:hypothetical protein [Pseudomonadota bacterium]
MYVLKDPFASCLNGLWQSCAAIWRDTAPGRIHYDDVFGVLTADYLGDQTFEVRYAGYVVRLYPAASACEIEVPDGVSKLPEAYVRSRIALVFLRFLSGCVQLHAGGICLGTDVIGLMAKSGVGKSTLTGACLALREDIGFVSDDVLTVTSAHAQPETGVLPSASYLAMRHDMWDGESFVEGRESALRKSQLLVREARRMPCMGRLKALVVLEEGVGICRLSSREAVPAVLRQQFSLSDAPAGVRRYQFGRVMSVLNRVPVYRMGISLNTRDEALERAAVLVETLRLCHD